MTRISALLTSLVATFCATGVARAVDLPDPIYYGAVSSNLSYYDSYDPIPPILQDNPGPGTWSSGFFQGSTAMDPNPSVSLSGYCVGGGWGCRGDAYSGAGSGPNMSKTYGPAYGTTYFFTVEGGTPGDVVSLDITGSLLVNSWVVTPAQASSAGAWAKLGVYQQNPYNTNYYFTLDEKTLNSGCNYAGCDGTQSWSGTLHGNFTVGTLGIINEWMGLLFVGDSHDGESAGASAYIDPYITIDPNTPNSQNYSVLVGGPAGNSPVDVPEPDSLALLGVGLTLLLVMRRRETRSLSRA